MGSDVPEEEKPETVLTRTLKDFDDEEASQTRKAPGRQKLKVLVGCRIWTSD